MAASDYVTLDQVRAYVYQSQDADEDLLIRIVTRAARIFDAACSLPDGYFAQGSSGQTASIRYYWGNGTDYLKIDPYLPSPAPIVTMPTGFAVLNWIEVNPYKPSQQNTPGEFFLSRRYGDDYSSFAALNERRDYFFAEFSNQVDYVGWPAGIRVGVTAKWGWDKTPEEVQEAVLETVANIWRSKDQGFARAVAIDGIAVINQPLPPRAQMIADGYKAGRAMFA
jgi:hypothetical protein